MKIGVFDSGFGGLSVLRRLAEVLPDYDYIYLGDNARAPYGSRDRQQITDFTTQAVDFLFKRDCQLVILACNTASALALRTIQQLYLPAHYPDRRVLGVLIPTAEAAVALSTKDRVGVMATTGTVSSGSFQSEIQKIKPSVRVAQQACPELVPLIEQGQHESDELVDALRRYCQPLIDEAVDSVILGCTHYELTRPIIRAILPPPIHIITEGAVVSERFADYLRRHPEHERTLSLGGSMQMLTTGDTERFEHLGMVFFAGPLRAEPAVLV